MSSAMSVRIAALALAGALLFGCGSSSSGGGGNAQPTATPRRGTPTRTLRPGQATSTPTATPTPVRSQTTRTRSPTGGPVERQTLFVRTNGSDDNEGTSRLTALRTVKHAAELAGPGTTVHIGPGVYLGRVLISDAAGTASNPVLFLGDPTGEQTGDSPGDVTLDPEGMSNTVLITRLKFVTLDSFVVRGAIRGEGAATTISVRSNSDDVTIKNCVIVDESNADGIRIDGSSDALIFNNILLQNDRGLIVLGGSHGTRVINNTIALNMRPGIVLAQRGGAAPSDTTVMNNIVQDSDGDLVINIDQGPPTSQEGYQGNFNLVFDPDVEDQAEAYRPPRVRGSSDVNADAMFVALAAGDVHLEPGSPAINAGNPGIGGELLTEMRMRSTTEDGAADDDTVDMGYHYPRPPRR